MPNRPGLPTICARCRILAASQFPKNRETRAPLVEELLPHKKEIDPKYKYLFSAPTEDDDGIKTVVRFSRKAKEHYVQSEVDGKATGWKATYEKGKWVVQDGGTAKKTTRTKAKPATTSKSKKSSAARKKAG